MRHTRQGFSLLEVILAVAIFSALVVSVLPLLAEATQLMATSRSQVDVVELRATADGVMNDEVLVKRISARAMSSLAWKAEHGVRSVEVRHISVTDEELPHEWIEFSCEGVRVLRYLSNEPKENKVTAMSRDSPP